MTARAIIGLCAYNLVLLGTGAGVLWGIRGWRWWTDFVRLTGLAYFLGVAFSHGPADVRARRRHTRHGGDDPRELRPPRGFRNRRRTPPWSLAATLAPIGLAFPRPVALRRALRRRDRRLLRGTLPGRPARDRRNRMGQLGVLGSEGRGHLLVRSALAGLPLEPASASLVPARPFGARGRRLPRAGRARFGDAPSPVLVPRGRLRRGGRRPPLAPGTSGDPVPGVAPRPGRSQLWSSG